MAILETLERGPEKPLGLRIQIVNPLLEEVGQSRSDGRLADAGTAAKKSSYPTLYDILEPDG